jgi:hypothetical protein
VQRELPHCQLSERSPGTVFEDLAKLAIELPNVGGRESRLAASNTCALTIPDALADGPKDAFIDDHEFCHIHDGGYVHLSLPREVRERVVELGWGESHPSAQAGFVPEGWMMLYAPRNEEELSVVMKIVAVSQNFAMGVEAEAF